jgi:hypothetical protein
MKLEIKSIKSSPTVALRRAGYIFQRQDEEEMSFVRPFSASGYPRFHMYVRVTGADMHISIHYDAKKETYGEGTRHHGEYDESSDLLRQEVRRLAAILED